MTRSRWLVVLVALTCIIPTSVATGATGADPLSLVALVKLDVEEARTDTEAVRAGLGGGSIESRLHAGLRAAHFPDTPSPVTPQLPGWAGRAISGLPEKLQAPVGEVVAAVTHGGALVEEALRSSPGARRAGRASLARLRGGLSPSKDSPRRFVRLERATAAAALLVARAVDGALPGLAAFAARHDAGARGSVEGCDLLDQNGICVASEAANRIVEDETVLIDLGGDDLYANNAGGADSLLAQRPIAVAIDLAGNDEYDATTPTRSGQFFVQGAAALGIGMLVDVAGTDSYVVRGGGGGQGAVLGPATVGALLDGGGNDRYLLRLPDRDVGLVTAMGQAASSNWVGPNLALLQDLGGGDDSYRADLGEIRTPPDSPVGGNHTMFAQGSAGVGTAILHDAGGTDAFHASGTAIRQGGEDPRWGSPQTPTQYFFGQGYAAGGTGMLLTGTGATSYTVDLTAEGLAALRVDAQGAALLGATGIVDDLAGNDLYTVRTTRTFRRDAAPDDAASVLGKFSSHTIQAQGFGLTGGVGLLEDHAGDDTYVASVSDSSEVRVVDHRPVAARAPVSVEGYGSHLLHAQGFGTFGGTGALLEGAGSDRYDLSGRNSTVASAVAPEGAPPRVVVSAPPMTEVAGQGASSVGAGAGVLVDAGGAGDVLRASVDTPVSLGTPGRIFRYASTPYVQGSSGGSIVASTAEPGPSVGATDASVLAVMGERPSISAAPSPGICAASADLNGSSARGYGVWSECPTMFERRRRTTIFSGGLAPRANGSPVQMTVGAIPAAIALEEAPSVDAPALPVSATVKDKDGNALPDRLVRFTLQVASAPFSSEAPVGDRCWVVAGSNCWTALWTSTGLTDEDGVATAELPLSQRDERWFNLIPVGTHVRVTAAFDGTSESPALYPHEAASNPSSVLQPG